MTKILFICHGNICRSIMAENIMSKIIRDVGKGNDFVIDSAATSTEEIGNLIYPPARRELEKHGIKTSDHRARRVTESDMQTFDYIICMESSNIRELFWVVSISKENTDKVSLLLDYTDEKGDVSDPWYTRDFYVAYKDIERGCRGLFTYLNKIKQEQH